MDSFWTEMHRRTAWSIITSSRFRLKINIETCVSTAFIMIHKYYIRHNSNSPPLFIVIVSALFSACKMLENVRSMQNIYSEVLFTCREGINRFGFQKFESALGRSNFDDCKIPSEDVKSINICEIDILESLDYKMSVELPFDHIETSVKPVINEGNKQLINKITKYICMLLCSSKATDTPPCVIAAVSTQEAFSSDKIPDSISLWISNIVKSQGEQNVLDVRNLLKRQISLMETPQKENK